MKKLKQIVKILAIIFSIMIFCAMSIVMLPLMIIVILAFNKKGKNFILTIGKYTGYEYLLNYLVDSFKLDEKEVF